MRNRFILLSLFMALLFCLPLFAGGEDAVEMQAELLLSADTVEAGKSLTVTVNVKEGQGPFRYTYRWYVSDANGNEQEIKALYDLPLASHTQQIKFGVKGHVNVQIMDQSGREIEKRADFVITGDTLPPLTLSAFLSADTVEAGSSLSVQVEASGGKKPYHYYYDWYIRETDNGIDKRIGGKQNVPQAYDSQQIKFGKSGHLALHVKDADGRSMRQTLPFSIKGDKPLAMRSFLSAREVAVGKDITIQVQASGGKAPYQYFYDWHIFSTDGSNDGKIAAVYGTANASDTQNIKFGKSGSVSVVVEDADGRKIKSTSNFKITGDSVPALSMNFYLSNKAIQVGESVTAHIRAQGGKAPYRYSYSWEVLDDGGQTSNHLGDTIASSKASDTRMIRFGERGIVSATLEDADGRKINQRATFTISGDTMPLIDMDVSISARTIETGGTLTVYADTRGGRAPYRYHYRWMTSDNKYGYPTQIVGEESDSPAASHSQQIKSGKTGFVSVEVSDADGRRMNRTLRFDITGKTNGWVEMDGTIYYYQNGVKAKAWLLLENKWYYFDQEGRMQTGWLQLGELRYYLGADGVMATGEVEIDGVVHLFAQGGAWQGEKPQKEGWDYVGGSWYYYKAGRKVIGWLQLGELRYYLGADGVMATGEVEIDGVVHLFAQGGAWQGEKDKKAGWDYVNGSWYYYKDGKKVTGWLYVGEIWYYLNASGVMVTGEIEIDGVVHLFAQGGAWQGEKDKKAGWDYVDGSWYYYKDGKKVTGWLYAGETWYYLNASGAMVTGEIEIDGKIHLFGSNGVWQGEKTQKEGWVNENGSWYYYKDGKKAAGWLNVSGTWYYLDANGVMVTGWISLSGTWYYFRSSGAMVTGEVEIDGAVHVFGAGGAWLGRK